MHRVALLLVAWLWVGDALAQPAAKRRLGAVAADHALASQAGAEILRHGGNAIDAAVATALVLGVVNPSSSGLGGGGFLVVWKDRKPFALDFRETAPSGAKRAMFLDDKGQPLPQRSTRGGLAVAVPGEAAGLVTATKRWGSLPWSRLIAPALRLATEGFPCGEFLAQQAARVVPELPKGHPMLAWLAPEGRPIRTGEIVRRERLAATLRRLSEDRWALQRGALVYALARADVAAGGVLTASDINLYRPVERTPLEGSYRGWRVVTMPAPSGGPALLETLQILEAKGPLPEAPLLATHRTLEALKHAFADRALIGDPKFGVDASLTVTAIDRAERLAAAISDERVLATEEYGDHPRPTVTTADGGTSHLCVADDHGDFAALTTTVNGAFGAWVEAEGVLLNNEMDDFATAPGLPNTAGLIGDEINTIAAGKRPRSSMAPTLLIQESNGRALCAGGSGGPTIISNTVQAILAMVDRNGPPEWALAAPRLHTQLRPDWVIAEEAVPQPLFDGLRTLGHRMVRFGQTPFGKSATPAVQAVRQTGHGWEAASDPRKRGKAVAF